MVDQRVAAARVAAIRDALNRVAQTLPADVDGLATDRTAREVVVLNLFVALQESVALAVHWLADDGLHVPDTYREIFLELADEHRIPPELARGWPRQRASGIWSHTGTARSTSPACTRSRRSARAICCSSASL
jgi:uncharacterized protein YutE (UPF0331/DUF86 family)